MAVIHTLLVFVGVACASLCTPSGSWWVTSRAWLLFLFRGITTEVVYTAGMKSVQLEGFGLTPLVYIFA